jgi:fructuronate reductase
VKLNRQSIREDRNRWLSKGYALPEFDLDEMARATAAAPEWVHFGAGNLFRALPAALCQQALNEGRTKSGILVASGYDSETLEAAYRPFDNLFALVTLRPDGSVRKSVIASAAEALSMDRGGADWTRLLRAFESPSLKLASLAVTEKGYNISGAEGEALPEIARDYAAGPDGAQSYLGKIASLLYARYASGALPVSLVSMDNCARNGDRLFRALYSFSEAWAAQGLAEPGFQAYLSDRARVGFPVTMVDKITPRPDESVADILEADGLTGIRPVRTKKGGLAAPYANAEEAQYLVMEDWFPNGRPALDGMSGVTFASREQVLAAERMKVCALLNPLHTALAVFGCLLGYDRIADEMRDALLVRLVETLGCREGLPTVDRGALDPEAFLHALLTERLPNPLLPDSPQRIATDTSQKMAVRFGETIKAHFASPGLSINGLVAIPLVIAGWLRYLVAVDDSGSPIQLSPDPLLPQLQAALRGIHLGDSGSFPAALRPVLSNESIFGVDLVKVGLSDAVEQCFTEMIAGPGAVRRVLNKYF